MKVKRRLAVILAVLSGGMPLATFATCDRDAAGGSFVLVSSADDLFEGALDWVFDEDDDD